MKLYSLILLIVLIVSCTHNQETFTEYYGNGKVKLTGPINQVGLAAGIFTYFDSLGVKTRETNFVEGQKEGEERVFFPSGAVQEILHYRQDTLNGSRYAYGPKESLLHMSTYKNGVMVGPAYFCKEDSSTWAIATYSDEGRLIKQENFWRLAEGEIDTGRVVGLYPLTPPEIDLDKDSTITIEIPLALSEPGNHIVQFYFNERSPIWVKPTKFGLINVQIPEFVKTVDTLLVRAVNYTISARNDTIPYSNSHAEVIQEYPFTIK